MTVVPPSSPESFGPEEAPRPFVAGGLVRAGLITYLFSGLTLIANLVTGVVTARALGPGGRGITVSLTTVSQLTGFLFALGAAQSLSYFIARRPQDGPSLLATWMLMLIPVAALAVGLAQLLLPVIFPDDPEAVTIGRWFMFTIVVVIGQELNYGLLLGIQDFVVYNVLRFAQPLLVAVVFVALWAVGDLTVESALLVSTLAAAVILMAGMMRSVRSMGVGRVDLRLGLRTAWFGIRGQGSLVASNVTARLDVAVLPAFVTSASVGLYSVATNISLIVYQLSNTFAGLVLPSAARDPERGRHKVVGSLWASLAVAGLLAIVLAVFAEPLLGLVYGDDFREAAESLRLLLPGAVLFAGSSILNAGIYAAGRPFTATVTQVVGMLATVVGLALFLSGGGITAAALVSSGSYAMIFAVSLVAYQRVSGLTWRELLPTPRALRALRG